MADEPSREPPQVLDAPKEDAQVTETPREEPHTTGASTPPSVSSNENEKASAPTTALDLDRVGETEGYLVDEAKLREKLGLGPDVPLKKSKSGIVLIPQPTEDPEDPLNWPRWKKAVMLIVISVNACTADYSAATGASALIPLAQQWHISPDTVNHATAG